MYIYLSSYKMYICIYLLHQISNGIFIPLQITLCSLCFILYYIILFNAFKKFLFGRNYLYWVNMVRLMINLKSYLKVSCDVIGVICFVFIFGCIRKLSLDFDIVII